MKKTIISISILLIAIVLVALVFDWGRRETAVAPELNQTATSTKVAERQIIVDYPIDNQVVTSPIHITGAAKGNWFFEASFPIRLIDSNGEVIATAIGQAQGDWMTTDYVNFSADISYPKATSSERAFLMLKNDNPSGDPARDQQILIPVILK